MATLWGWGAVRAGSLETWHLNRGVKDSSLMQISSERAKMETEVGHQLSISGERFSFHFISFWTLKLFCLFRYCVVNLFSLLIRVA